MNTSTRRKSSKCNTNGEQITVDELFKKGITKEFVIKDIIRQKKEIDEACGIYFSENDYIAGANADIETVLQVINRGPIYFVEQVM
jgi:hypothetical protein